MDYPLGTITVDWSLIKIWCCGRFLSRSDVPAHTQLCHAQAASSKEETRCRSGPSRRTRQFRPASPQIPQKLRKSTEISTQEGEIESPVTQPEDSSRKRKENEEVTNEASDETSNNLEKLHSSFQKRKSKMDSENDLSSAMRADLTSSSVDISDLKDTFIDTIDIEGDSEVKMETIRDNMPNINSEDAYLEHKELTEQKIAVDKSNSSSVKNVKVMILHAHGVIKKLEERKREKQDQHSLGNLPNQPSPEEADINCLPKSEETESSLISTQSINENSQKVSLNQESTLISNQPSTLPINKNSQKGSLIQESVVISNQPSTQLINENSQKGSLIQESVVITNQPSTQLINNENSQKWSLIQESVMISNQPSTPQILVSSGIQSTQRTVITPNQPYTSQIIVASDPLSTPRTRLALSRCSTPQTIITTNKCSTPRTIENSIQIPTPEAISGSNQLSTPRTFMASTRCSTPPTILDSKQFSTPCTIMDSNQLSTPCTISPRSIMAANQFSTPCTIMDSNQLPTPCTISPRTIIASTQCSTPSTTGISIKLSTPRTMLVSNQRSTTPCTIRVSNELTTPQIMDTVNAEDKNAQMSTKKVSQCKNIVDKTNVKKKSNKKEVSNHRISKVKAMVKTNSSDEDKWKSKAPVYCQQKMKKETKKKENSSKTKDFSPIGGDANDSDNEAVSTDMDFSCKVRNCLANFWFKSQLDQHTLDVHNY